MQINFFVKAPWDMKELISLQPMLLFLDFRELIISWRMNVFHELDDDSVD